MSDATSSYTGVAATDNFPTDKEVKAKSREDVKDFLNARRKELDLKDQDINKLYDQRIDGNIFLALKYEILVNPPLSIPVGPAINLVNFINKIQEETITNSGLVYVYVDYSNVVIEGKYNVGAFENIYDPIKEQYYMNQFEIDFGCLLTIIQCNRKLGSNLVIVGSRPPPNDSVWKKIEDQGFKTEIFNWEEFKDNDNKIHIKEKHADTQIAVSMVINSLIKVKKPGILILVAGDGDFEPALKPIMEAGWIVEIRFWANSTSRHLKDLKVGENEVKFMSLDPDYKSFSFGSGPDPTNKKKILEVVHENNLIIDNKELIGCYSGLQSSFCWWQKVSNESFYMYFNTDTDLQLARSWLKNNLIDVQAWKIYTFRDCTNDIYCPKCTYCISDIISFIINRKRIAPMSV